MLQRDQRCFIICQLDTVESPQDRWTQSQDLPTCSLHEHTTVAFWHCRYHQAVTIALQVTDTVASVEQQFCVVIMQASVAASLAVEG